MLRTKPTNGMTTRAIGGLVACLCFAVPIRTSVEIRFHVLG